ncbi:hypothetical protein RhiirA4_474714 [Rhizophagus irregularis]|uniref:Uncharacterized protein n=1 Tax=Rhizophagus irregularis TaxID=588596 RepID=A0A2I1H903_9GLOM|nr:hypothetical protein RhiirA4_474714 [Rhizophagus irregularis]
MPNESCPLVSISSSLANSETSSWLKSAIWYLSQLLDPFHRFQYTWMDLKKMGLVANTGRIPSWFKEISSIPNLPSLILTPRTRNIDITPSLSLLIGKFVDKIDETTHIRLRNKYYWIAGIDSSNSLIFGRAFYTLDDSFGNRFIYFSHWIPTSHDRIVLTPCPVCSLHSLVENEGPLALKSVGGKLLHRSCLSAFPSYRCLHLFQMTSHIDISQQFINLKLSPFLLCSYFKFLLGYSEMYIPEQFLVVDVPSVMQSDTSPTQISLDPAAGPLPAFALCSDSIFHIKGSVHELDESTSYLICAWVQTLDDFILDSGVFSCPMVSPYDDIAELTFITYVLNSLPFGSSVEFNSFTPFKLLYQKWRNVSPIKRVRIKNNFLWSSISELLRTKGLACGFIGPSKDEPPSPHLIRAKDLKKKTSWTEQLQPIPLLDIIFPSTLKTMGLFTGFDELLTADPITYWCTISDIRRFFSLLGLSRFTELTTSYHSVDWALTFDNFKHTLYQRSLVSKISVFLQFHLKLWFDELPIMYRLSQRYPGLYADDSLCPNCRIFMETLEHLFICSPDFMDESIDNPEPLQHKDIIVDFIQRFLVKLATKVSSSPKCKQTYEEILSALRNIEALGLPSLVSNSTNSSFPASCIVSRTFMKLQREIYHKLWRPRCKLKALKDLAKGISPSILRSYRGPSVQPFRFSAPQVTLSLADGPLSPLQASEWASLGIHWFHSSLT